MDDSMRVRQCIRHNNMPEKKFVISIETSRGPAWGTYNGIEGYHYTLLKDAAKAFTKEEIELNFVSRLSEKTAYRIEET